MPAGQSALGNSDTLDIEQLLRVLIAVKKGDFSVRMPVEYTGIAGKIADTLRARKSINSRD